MATNAETIKKQRLNDLKVYDGYLKKQLDAGYAKKEDVKEYSIVKKQTANSGYIASYQLTKGGTAVGVDIDIPKDYFVKSASVGECSVENQPTTGLAVGDKYIDLVINTSDDGGTASHVYIAVKDMITAYTAGNGIEITGSSIAVKINSAKANGLSAGTAGLELAAATESSPGAMTAEMAKKLGGIEDGANRTTVDESLSLDSENPVQNKAVKTELDKKLTANDFEEITEADIIAAFAEV